MRAQSLSRASGSRAAVYLAPPVLSLSAGGLAATAYLAGIGTSAGVAITAGVLVVVFGLMEYLALSLRGQGHLLSATGPRDALGRFGGLVIWVLVLGFSAARASATGLLLCLLLAGLVAVGVAGKLATERGAVRAGFAYFRSSIGRSYRFAVSSIALAYFSVADVVLAGAVLEPAMAGQYFLANRLVLLLEVFNSAAALVVTPEIAPRLERGDQETLGQLLRRASGIAAALALASAVVLVSAAPKTVTWVAGSVDHSFFWIICTLATGRVLAVLLGVGAVVPNMAGKPEIVFRSFVTVGWVSVPMSILAGSFFGALGLAVASACSLVAYRASISALAARRLDVESAPLARIFVALRVAND